VKTIIPAIYNRRAYRALKEKPIPDDVEKRILEAGVLAPSCFNNQPWRFIVVNQEQSRSLVREALPDANYWAKKAPLYILVITKPDLDCSLKTRREYALYDTGFAAMNIITQATEEGLIAHPIAGYKDSVLRKAFDIPDDFILINVIVFGYPGDDSELNEKHKESERSERSRKPLEEVISYNTWGFPQ
jgi:nitroreductase